MPENTGWLFLNTEQRQERARKLHEDLAHLRHIEAESARIARDYGLQIQPELLAGTSFDTFTPKRGQ